jgi:signal transduction histidine kinase
LKEGRFASLTTKQGLPTDHIEVMLLDGRGWIWCVGSEEIFKINEAEAEAVMEGRARRVQPVRLGEEQGVHPIFGEVIGALRRHDGKLWIPFATSLAIIDPAQQRTLGEPPPVWITDVTVDEHPLASYHGVLPLRDAPDFGVQALHLPPSYRRMDIAFTALSFEAPTNVAFRYKLENFDDQWIDAKSRRSASYSRLGAGSYRFRVAACNSDGVWNDSGATFAFVVDPFFWETWWFRTAGVALFTAAVYFATRLISNRRLRRRLRAVEQEAAVERERARIARDIHDDLGSRLTRIVLLSGLAVRESTPPERAGERVREISDTARQLIKSLDETVWAVNPKNDTLPHFVSYVGQFAVNFLRTAEIACELELPEDPPALPLTAEVRHNLFLAVKEALHNVVRHAHASRVWLRLSLAATTLEISIADDGQGFTGDPTDPEADGLRNMRQRLAQLGGTVRIESRVGGGTHVTFTMPRPAAIDPHDSDSV